MLQKSPCSISTVSRPLSPPQASETAKEAPAGSTGAGRGGGPQDARLQAQLNVSPAPRNHVWEKVRNADRSLMEMKVRAVAVLLLRVLGW